MESQADLAAIPPVLASGHVVAGLGAAPRELLATCLALFDDSTLQRRISTLVQQWSTRKHEAAASADTATIAAVQDSVWRWQASPLSNDALRVVLWMYLRDAFGLPAATFASMRSAGTAADDIVARALHLLQPAPRAKLAQQLGLTKGRSMPATLDALARRTMQEMMSSLEAGDARSRQACDRFLADTRARLAELPPEDRARLMQAAGVDDLNDAALRSVLLTGGGLGVFSASVGLAGFSTYILAAQASALIPLVSGPALVSLVAVLSNPITVIAATVGMGWWAAHSVSHKVRGSIGVRVLSLLALNGLEGGAAGVRNMLGAFAAVGRLTCVRSLRPEALAAYQADWARIAGSRRKPAKVDASVLKLMESRAGGAARGDPFGQLLAGARELHDPLALSALTLGDILYNAYSLSPGVLEAADFSRVEDLEDPVAFAAFAHGIESMSPDARLGAFSSLKGYVAERVVAARLVEQGHVVEFPGTANEAGWDISVDGALFQIKDTTDLSGLQRHFERGYDYPVFANGELASELASRAGEALPEWADRVHFVEGYSNEIVEHLTRSSLEAGADMLHPDVPLFALLLSGVRNLQRMNRGEVTGSQAVQEFFLDGGTRAGLAVAGNYMGAGIGLVVFGPAGALVLGAVVPIVSQLQSGRVRGMLDQWAQDASYRAWAAAACGALSELVSRAGYLLRRKIGLVRSRRPLEAQAVVVQYLQWRVDDELCFLREAHCRLKSISDDTAEPIERVAQRVLVWLSTSTLHPSSCQREVTALGTMFRRRPSTVDRVSGIAGETVEAASTGIRTIVRRFSAGMGSSSDKKRG
ncbi:hypothetical protein [Coralloluteibacterium stylophorae]|uniref:Uncharacterized protein n=1 Tax=Coralloluteibacterium stylophorae TaxID=1776034 RepID=A0A8J7VXD1_9GAMM|nr:hypothetical protein [Coralloluteibacterium stylophorae]MBS7455719.1 hypothetical protein [Coralloluteibacterium stylophorae]